MLAYRPGYAPGQPGFQRNALVAEIADFTPLPDMSGIDPCPIPHVNHTLVVYKGHLGLWKRRQELYTNTPPHQWEYIKLTGAVPHEETDPVRRDGTTTQDWKLIKWAIFLTVSSLAALGIYRFVELKYFKTWK